MTDESPAHTADSRISTLTGEFVAPELEQTYLGTHWNDQSRQFRIVLWLSIIFYLFAFYQNYIDLGDNINLWVIGAAHFIQFAFMGWAIFESYAPTISPRLQYLVFIAEILTGVSETVEMLAYNHAGIVINLVSAPFYAFVILIFFIFLRIRWALTAVASLIGGTILVLGYAYIAWDHLDSIVRHPIMLLGIIALGGGAVRGMNRVDRHGWLQSKRLEFEVSERRRAEALALEASRAKSEFLAVMSHEIRTPLNSILAMTEVLSSDKAILNERNQHQLDILTIAGKHLCDLVDDVLDLSRIEAKANTLSCEPFVLRKTVDKAISAVHNLAKRKGLVLEAHIDPTVPHQLLGDPRYIRQILINLVGNAIKFTEVGRIDLQVSQSGGATHFVVSDTGIGIAEKDLAKIFEPFQQSDPSSSRQNQGTGLGLAITQNLVEQMGGTITAQNRPTGGALFECRLPLGIVDEEEAQATVKPPTHSAKPPAVRFRALVVEDSELNRMVIEEYLANVECDLQFAEDGRQGLELFKTGAFDIVLMDLQMPEIDGISATRMIRDWEHEHGLTQSPIVLITADNRAESRERAVAAGISDYLAKPMSKADLYNVLSAHLLNGVVASDEQKTGNPVLASLLPRFFEQMVHDIEAMGRAFQDEELVKLKALAHAIKGHSQMFGFDKLAKAAAAMEHSAESATAITPQLQAAWEELKAVYDVAMKRQCSAE